MKLLHSIDDYLIARAESFSHWLQRMIGTSSRDIASLCVVLYIAEIIRHGYPGIVLVVAADGILRLISFQGTSAISNSGHMNTEKLTGFRGRMIMLSVVPVAITIGDFFMIPFLLSYYFEACDDMPPGESRFKKWLTSARAAMSMKRVTA